MERRCDVSIRECANGYIVDQRDGPVDPHRVAAGKMVFPNWESLSAWMAVHFSKADPVEAPEGVEERFQALLDTMARPPRPWKL
jgi:hypothetical protein